MRPVLGTATLLLALGLAACTAEPAPQASAPQPDLEELKVKEIKHCRLAMGAWLGCISQALVTKEGPIANWSAHVADPVHVNLLAPGYCKDFGLYCVAY